MGQRRGLRGGHQIGPERRAPIAEPVPHRVVERALAGLRRGDKESRLVAERQPHPAVSGPQRPRADPHQLTGGAELIELGRLVAGHAAGQHIGFQHRCRQGRALQLGYHVGQGIHAAAPTPDPLPGGQEPRQRLGRHGLHLLAQRGQATATDPSQDVGVAELPLETVRPELTQQQTTLGDEGGEGVGGPGLADPQPARHVAGGERSVGAGEAGAQVAQRILPGLDRGRGQPHRQGCAGRVAQP